MKSSVFLFLLIAINLGNATAQGIAEGIKFLSYDKNKSAAQILQKEYNANAKDANVIYWYGQALIANKDFKGAKTIYQKALQENINDPYIWIGMAHVELMEGGDINAAKQKFEQAITATTETKGKNKNKPNPAILNAIGRANADGGSKIGDANYAIDKLQQAGELDKLNAEIFVNMGILYQKLGGDNGGEAVKAYSEAITRDPKNADAFWHIGKIYASQGNKDLLEQYYNNGIAADASYPKNYLGLFEYYQYKDINKAKEYIDKFIQYADKDCVTDFYYADYLFKAGKNQESLDKAKAMQATECSTYALLPILFAYNYDRLNDSIAAKASIEKFFATAPIDKIEPAHYELAVKVLSKFPGNEMATASYLQKAMDNDTTKAARLVYLKQGAEMFGKAKMFTEQVKWLQKFNTTKVNLSETDYFNITVAAYASKDYVSTMQYAKNYIASFSDKPNGYAYNVRAAKALDTTTNPGIAIEAINLQNDFYAKDTEKNKKALSGNYYYLMVYYADKLKDYEKAIEYCDKILALNPGDADMTNIKATLTKMLTNKTTPPGKQPATPDTKSNQPNSADKK